MKFKNLILGLALSTSVFASYAQASTNHSAQASNNLSYGVGQSVAAVAQPVSAVVASPVMASGAVVGSAGAVSAKTGNAVFNSHNNIPGAFVITKKTVTAGPTPYQASR